MASYVVMEPASPDRDPVFVRDGFHVFAFLLPVPWLLFHRLWIEAALAFALTAALSATGSWLGLAGAPLLTLLVSIYVGLEGAALKVAALRRRGWREWGVIDAEGTRDAELRYADRHDAEDDLPVAPAALPWVQPQGRPVAAGPALGLFSYPGQR